MVIDININNWQVNTMNYEKWSYDLLFKAILIQICIRCLY